ncbi:hypothetical protein FRC08_016670 [Ceratobasidium sp. 394]|nr:hypothetical protein FRC08_016670 [Ceratobasidium sp. 394]
MRTLCPPALLFALSNTGARLPMPMITHPLALFAYPACVYALSAIDTAGMSWVCNPVLPLQPHHSPFIPCVSYFDLDLALGLAHGSLATRSHCYTFTCSAKKAPKPKPTQTHHQAAIR